MTISMLEVADRTFKKIIRRRVSDEGEWERIESVWMNHEIREAINERRINRGNETLWSNIGKLTGKKLKEGEEKIYQDGKLME